MRTDSGNTARQSHSASAPYLVRVEHGFDFLGTEYRAFFAAHGVSPFQNPIWLANFYQILCPARTIRPVVVTARDASGALLLVFPGILRVRSGLRLLELSELGVSDYCAPVISSACFEPGFDQAAFRDSFQAALPGYDVLRLQKIRDQDLDLVRLLFDAPVFDHDFSAHVTPIDQGYQTWVTERFNPNRWELYAEHYSEEGESWVATHAPTGSRTTILILDETVGDNTWQQVCDGVDRVRGLVHQNISTPRGYAVPY